MCTYPPVKPFGALLRFPPTVSHMVQNLALHLPDEQEVTFQDGEEEETFHNAGSDTMLTAFLS